MGQTLTNGIYLPSEGERNCYAGLAANWNAVDTLKGNYSLHAINVDIHVTATEKETWNGKADASALTAHTGDTTIHVTSADKQAWNGKADASALTAHTGNTTIHVTAEDKQAWNGKADASALTAHTGDTTIHVTSADKQAWDGHVADSVKHVTAEDKQTWNGKADASALTAHTGDTTIHVTAADKQTWDTVTNKANDADVLHKSGDETKTGKLTVTELNTTKINNLNPGALSLPDLNSGIDISSYITQGTGHNEYTPPANGYVSIILKNTSATAIFLYQGDFGRSSYSSTALPNETDVCCINSIPVLSGTKVNIDIKGANSYIVSAKFYPCQGNV